MPGTKPNIIMIMVDQMSYDVIGALGHPVVRTPNLDRLVENGTIFTNCYCNSPLCSPSRASLFTGLYIRNNGVYDNAAELSAEIPTLMHCLRVEGYETIGLGKMHFVGPDQLHGFEYRLTTDVFPSHFGWNPEWDQGVRFNGGANASKVKNAGVCKWNGYYAYDEEVLYRSLEKLRGIADHKGKPFFMYISFTHPHQPFEALQEYYRLYEDMDIPLPEAGFAGMDHLHPYDAWMGTHLGLDRIALAEEDIIRARRAYYAMVTYVDGRIGKILDEVRRLGMDKDTLIIFTSDHGEMLGEHGMWFKRTYYEHSVRVPMIFTGPGMIDRGKRIHQVVSLVDLFPTVLQLCGIEIGNYGITVDGDSFARLLHSEDRAWKNRALFEYYADGINHPMAGLRKDHYKYIYVHGQKPLLFDLEKDPKELKNLAGRQGYEKIGSDMEKLVLDGWDAEDTENRILQSQRRRSLIHRALNCGCRFAWDFQPFFDASKQYVR